MTRHKAKWRWLFQWITKKIRKLVSFSIDKTLDSENDRFIKGYLTLFHQASRTMCFTHLSYRTHTSISPCPFLLHIPGNKRHWTNVPSTQHWFNVTCLQSCTLNCCYYVPATAAVSFVMQVYRATISCESQCWTNVLDVGTAYNQRWTDVEYLLEIQHRMTGR